MSIAIFLLPSLTIMACSTLNVTFGSEKSETLFVAIYHVEDRFFGNRCADCR